MSETKRNALPKRDEIDNRFKWKIEDIYISIQKWEEDFDKVKSLCGEIVNFRGKLKSGPETLINALRLGDDLLSLNDCVYAFARMKRDENNADPVYQVLTDRASALSTEVYAAISFIVPEIISIDEKVLNKFMKDPGMQVYSQFINDTLRQKKHTLSEREEEIIALSTEIASASGDIFTMFNNADIKFPYIKDENGEEIELTKGRYVRLLESKNRRVRRDAFKALYNTYAKHSNTLAAMLTSNIKATKFYSGLRNYGSCLESALETDNIPVEVYDNLIATVNNNLHLLHRYMKLRKKILNVEQLHMYDLYVPLVEQPEKHIAYETALETVEKGLTPMGEKYIADLKRGFEDGWIDVFENEGKTSGAYSWGTYKHHPFVLLNYQGTTNDLFTIAHEMGHALHSYYTNNTQPYVYSQYKIFVAEVASTVNESLLMKHMLKDTEDPKEKAYLLNHYLEEFRGTVFRQTMFAEFEKETHARIEKGEALTSDALCTMYKELNKKYFGDEVLVDDEVKMEWARIPHFYSDFYVYKYATGFSAAVALSEQILNEGGPAVERYTGFLSSGSSDYPLELLKKAGVDLSTPYPVQGALNLFERILDELEDLIA